jgi:glycosyltransferase involved in cell wall biosynthesis
MLSFVVPVFNEEESLVHFYDALMDVIPSLNKAFDGLRLEKHEIIFVDDGSTDSSLEILKSLAEKDKNVKAFSFRRNLGKAEALTFGFMKAEGDYIVTLDADLQDKPSEIHKLLDKAKEGVEVVCGWRKDRKDKSKMVVISKIFNNIMGYFFGLDIHDYNCGLKLYTRDAAKSLRLYGGMHRFIPMLLSQQGFVVDEVAVHHEVRKFGTSKYGFSKLWTDLPDIFSMLFLAKYSKRPLHFFGIVGGVLSLAGLLILSYLTLLRIFGESIGRRPLLFFGMLLILAGFQIFFTGFLADLMINISRNKESLDESHVHFPLKYSPEKVSELKR